MYIYSTHARTHARAHTRARTHTHMYPCGEHAIYVVSIIYRVSNRFALVKCDRPWLHSANPRLLRRPSSSMCVCRRMSTLSAAQMCSPKMQCCWVGAGFCVSHSCLQPMLCREPCNVQCRVSSKEPSLIQRVACGLSSVAGIVRKLSDQICRVRAQGLGLREGLRGRAKGSLAYERPCSVRWNIRVHCKRQEVRCNRARRLRRS